MNPTPIYDQLCGERLNADIPTTGADPHQVSYPIEAGKGSPSNGD